MPIVGKEHFSYTPEGKRAAEEKAKKTGQKIKYKKKTTKIKKKKKTKKKK